MKISITLPSIFPDALRRAHDNIAASAIGPYELVVVADFERPSWALDRVIRERKATPVRFGLLNAPSPAISAASQAIFAARQP